jgi:hypothetical protein
MLLSFAIIEFRGKSVPEENIKRQLYLNKYINMIN